MSKHESEDGADKRSRLLDDLRRNKRNRSLKEVEAVLEEFGFSRRDAAKEASVWSRGRSTLTLPNPHGKPLKTPYVRLVVRIIEQAEAAEKSQRGENDEG